MGWGPSLGVDKTVFEEVEKVRGKRRSTFRDKGYAVSFSHVVPLRLTSADEYFKTSRAPSWFEVSVLYALGYYFLAQ